ncbi:hypothetical protein F53441_8290 [Fusarium austroafricanum]|uniref:Ankyrin repeat protein n=1 Tax=Fusarium austroafricanum TaxID=2364996 RepID=A0A8H4KD55_9HYPO|nr:hypothetical protein F53441_8290 [Fusarium austroafricanum]
MPYSHQPSPSRSEVVVKRTQAFLNILSTSISKIESITIPADVYPLDTFIEDSEGDIFYFPAGETQLEVSPLCWAAHQGLDAVIHAVVGISRQTGLPWHQEDLNRAMFLALYFGHRNTADLLKEFGAQPGRGLLFTAIHAAARQGLKDEIFGFIRFDYACPDVRDASGATPVMYAMQLDHPRDWETIDFLFRWGADPRTKVNNKTYAQYARKMPKWDLARQLEIAAEVAAAEETGAAAAEAEPTLFASSDPSSCTHWNESEEESEEEL